MEKAMKRPGLPNIDSIEGLAEFWDTHDLTEFEVDLEQAGEPIFVRVTGTSLSIDLTPSEAQQLKRIARSRRVKDTTVVRDWILEKLHASSSSPRRTKKTLRRCRISDEAEPPLAKAAAT